MNTQLVQSIIYHFVAQAKTEGVFDLGATKLVKLLYLIDCEYYRWQRQTATGAPWVFYHFGPYSEALIEVAQQTPGVAFLEPMDLDGDRTFKGIRLTAQETETDPLSGQPLQVKAAVAKVCERWLSADLTTLLNHVYFRTEPMNEAIRGTPLDFSTIPDPRTEPKPEVVPNIGGLVSEEVKTQLQRRLREKCEQTRRQVAAVQVDLDDDAQSALQRMDAEDATDLPLCRIKLENNELIPGA